ncbi:MAG: Hsp20/alpha crystallin family protein, partial [Deltaproteobacteria bacterium]
MSNALSTRSSRELQPLLRPFRLLQREFDELFDRLSSGWDGRWLTGEFSVPCDLSETTDAFQVRMDVPGIKADDINVQVTGNT